MDSVRADQASRLIGLTLGVGGLIAVWHFGVQLSGVDGIIVPGPIAVWEAFLANWRRILSSLSLTLTEAALGFVLATLVAIVSAASFVLSTLVRRTLYPLAIALKAAPLITLAPLIIIWFGDGMQSKVVMSALLAYFPILVAVFDGLQRSSNDALDLMTSLRATPWQVFRMIRIPNAAPNLFSSLKIAAPISVVGAVIGEYTGSTAGVGHLINIESYYLNTDVVFAAIICLSLASGLFFALVALAEKRVIYW